ESNQHLTPNPRGRINGLGPRYIQMAKSSRCGKSNNRGTGDDWPIQVHSTSNLCSGMSGRMGRHSFPYISRERGLWCTVVRGCGGAHVMRRASDSAGVSGVSRVFDGHETNDPVRVLIAACSSM